MKKKKSFIRDSVLVVVLFGLFLGIISLGLNPEEETNRGLRVVQTEEDNIPSIPSNASKPSPQNYGPYITYANIEQQLSQNDIVKDLPENAVLLLQFYNFKTGFRVWEKSYILKKNYVKEGSIENPDLTITLSSKYLGQMTPGNFCNVIQIARANNDLGIYTELSNTQLLWKFKSMYEYRECLGF
jgi:hypothetical protein